jgi:hypothetical protein
MVLLKLANFVLTMKCIIAFTNKVKFSFMGRQDVRFLESLKSCFDFTITKNVTVHWKNEP